MEDYNIINEEIFSLAKLFKDIKIEKIKSIYFETEFNYNLALEKLNNYLLFKDIGEIKLYSKENSFLDESSSLSSDNNIENTEFNLVNLKTIGILYKKNDNINKEEENKNINLENEKLLKNI